jgi:acylphosphatase
MPCRRFLVSGRVQGVAFRAYTRMHAVALGLSGWAANLRDGRVEVVAIGDDARIGQLRERLVEGPPAARVTAVDETEPPQLQTDAQQGFTIR